MTAAPDRTRLRTVVGTLAAAGALALATAAPAGADVTPGSGDVPRVIVATGSGKCLEVADWRTDDGAPVRQWSCTGGANQQWIWGADGRIVNAHSGKCLDIPGFSTTWGTPADQWSCDGGTNQQWKMIIPPRTAVFFLENAASQLFLDISGASTADGAPVIQWQPTQSAPNQYWRYDPPWR